MSAARPHRSTADYEIRPFFFIYNENIQYITHYVYTRDVLLDEVRCIFIVRGFIYAIRRGGYKKAGARTLGKTIGFLIVLAIAACGAIGQMLR